jgi:hypothetical protein
MLLGTTPEAQLFPDFFAGLDSIAMRWLAEYLTQMYGCPRLSAGIVGTWSNRLFLVGFLRAWG